VVSDRARRVAANGLKLAMRKLFLLVLAIAAAYFGYFDRLQEVAEPTQKASDVARKSSSQSLPITERPRDRNDALQAAFEKHQSNVQIHAQGTVTKVLSDDNSGSRHQRFIVKLPSGQTVLVAHNIDLASRIDSLKEGDAVQFFGEYEWNDRGGVVHWTHRDPAKRHTAGWIKHRGQTYQ
jgi:hypothetical protein